jgi:hypothetical protein
MDTKANFTIRNLLFFQSYLL